MQKTIIGSIVMKFIVSFVLSVMVVVVMANLFGRFRLKRDEVDTCGGAMCDWKNLHCMTVPRRGK